MLAMPEQAHPEHEFRTSTLNFAQYAVSSESQGFILVIGAGEESTHHDMGVNFNTYTFVEEA